MTKQVGVPRKFYVHRSKPFSVSLLSLPLWLTKSGISGLPKVIWSETVQGKVILSPATDAIAVLFGGFCSVWSFCTDQFVRASSLSCTLKSGREGTQSIGGCVWRDRGHCGECCRFCERKADFSLHFCDGEAMIEHRRAWHELDHHRYPWLRDGIPHVLDVLWLTEPYATLWRSPLNRLTLRSMPSFDVNEWFCQVSMRMPGYF